jgi:uncharacterized membrane protein YcaP (DUF421 family)
MTYIIIAMRIVSAMALLLFLTLRTGRRKIGELPVYDFLSIIVLGSVIGADIADTNLPHLPTLYSVVLIVGLQYLVSCLMINNKRIAKKITFGPTIVIQNGQFLKSNMERLKYSTENIRMALREKDVFDLNEVEYAIVEGSGNISILKKARYLPLTPSDMNANPTEKSLFVPLIIDGIVHEDNLRGLNHDMAWLTAQLKNSGIVSTSEVFYAECDESGNMYVSKRIQTQNIDNGLTL